MSTTGQIGSTREQTAFPRPAWATETTTPGTDSDGTYSAFAEGGDDASVEVMQLHDAEGVVGPAEAWQEDRGPFNAQQCRDLASAFLKAATIIDNA